MLALLLFSVLPRTHQPPIVESIELNYVVRPVRVGPCDWHIAGWERSLSQAIVRGPHSGTNRIEIMGWAGGGVDTFRPEKINGWWVVKTNQGYIRSRVLTETFTDYDPEALERETLASERRAGWPK